MNNVTAEEDAKMIYHNVPLIRNRGIMNVVKWVGWAMENGFCIVIAE